MPRTPALVVAARILLVPYVVALGLIVWLPADAASGATGIVFEFARFVSEQSGVPLQTSYTVFEFVANIVLFVPFGLLVAIAWPRLNVWWVILAGFSTSALIELVQLVVPERVSTISDVIANTLGTVIGCFATRGIRSLSKAAKK
ncbi:VanZ family protein [Microbacterium sp. A204]|uniref:VanZ family protein n=1 Tax=Microbacterium sp. A204 TaxID=3457321 RepID=UPI003FD5D89F